MSTYAEMEIGLHRWDENSYEIDFRFTEPSSDSEVRPCMSNPLMLDFDALDALGDDNDAYGRFLTKQFFADANIKSAFGEAQAVAEQKQLAIRLRLRISPTAARLHTIRWETLHNPSTDEPLLTNENIVFSRSIDSGVWKQIRVRPQGDLKALVVIANPSNLNAIRTGGPPLALLDVSKEEASAREHLAGYEVTALASGGKATLSNVIDAIRSGVDIIYLLCHGFMRRDEPRLILENDEGNYEIVDARELVRQMRDLREPPRLIVLASCESGGSEEDERTLRVVSRLGPQLAAAGVPAVVAMQGSITVETASGFLSRFFEQLRLHGEIDRAVAVARAGVQTRSDSWMPALYMRLKTGKIWFETDAGAGAGSFAQWDAILENIHAGRCTPILGFGVYDELFGSTPEIARRWAETYRYPFALGGRDDLPQVAQYLFVNNDRQYPRYELKNHFRRELQKRYPEIARAFPPDVDLDTLVTAVWQKAATKDDVHRVLARLPCPLYVTTNVSTILERALAEVGREPVSAICPWYAYAEPTPLPKPLTRAKPVVYHQFGRLDQEDSIVVSEDDYFDYLIGTTAQRDLIDGGVRSRFNNSSLMFLGFQVSDWNFRALFRSLATSEGRLQRDNFAHVAVQVNPYTSDFEEPDVVFAFLERYFQKQQITIFRGTVAEFVGDIARRWRKRYGEDLTQ